MDKIQILKSIKISTSQRSSLLNEAKVMKVVKSAKSLGMTDFKAIGFSKILNNYVIVFYGKYSSIMSNVKGCSSLANKRELSSFEIITNEEFEKLMKEDIS